MCGETPSNHDHFLVAAGTEGTQFLRNKFACVLGEVNERVGHRDDRAEGKPIERDQLLRP